MLLFDLTETINHFVSTHREESIKMAFVLAVVLPFVLLYPVILLIERLWIKRRAGDKPKLLQAIGLPVRLFIVKTAIFFSIRLVAGYFDLSLPQWLGKLQGFIGFALIIVALWHVIDFVENLILKKGKDPTLAQITGNVLKVIIAFVFLLGILQLFGTSLSGLLAFGGMGGLVVGMAAKDLLANIFGSVMIFLDKPFKVGDWITSPDRDIEGTVEKIGLRITTIRNFDKRPIYVPNSIFSNIIVENPTRMNFRRINERIGIRHEDADKIESIITQIQQFIDKHPEIMNTENPTVSFDSFNLNSLDIVVNAHCSKTGKLDYQRIKQEVLLKIIEIIKNHHAQCAKSVSQIYLTADKNKHE